MKNNAKRLAALLMVLALLFSVSATAFASTVYSNIITVRATEKPEETPAPEVTEEPVVTDDPEATEEPVVTDEPEATEEPVVTDEPEATEEPAATLEPEPTPSPEELLANVTISVACEIITAGEFPAFGDTVKLTAIVTGAEELNYSIVWEYRSNKDTNGDWLVFDAEVPEGEDPETYIFDVIYFPLTLENYTTEWRARLVLILPEEPVAEEPAVETADDDTQNEGAKPAVAEESTENVEETPVVEEPAPVVEEPAAPVVEEPAPVVEEPAPVVEEPAPEVEEVPAE